MHCEAQLDSILSEGVQAARQRERTAFDSFAGGYADAIILYGAGNLGRKALHGLRKHGVEPRAFVDRNPGLWGKSVEGVPVFSPEEAAPKFGKSAAFVVCVWHPDREHGVQHIIEHLGALGAERVTSFVPLFWKYSQHFLPYFFWELPSRLLAAEGKIRQAFAALHDDSQAQFVHELHLRLYGSFAQMLRPHEGEQYFPRELFQIAPDECFVDCGAYDGDTIRALIAQSGGRFRKVIAFEPDASNCERLRKYVAADINARERVVIHELAVTRTSGRLSFAATAGSDAAISVAGDTLVHSRSLDDALAGEAPTMVKMDIEGAELEALEGAARTIRAHNPLLAVCVYHCPDHLWSVPLWIKNADPEAQLFLRPHVMDGLDSVCYAVPQKRSRNLQ